MILASYIRPFDAKQKIYVLDEKKNTEEVRLADLSSNYAETIMQLITEYNVNTLELHGNTAICERVGQEVKQAEFTKYNNNQLKIVLKGVE